MESATESRLQRFCVVQVKRCGKSAPVPMETSEARQTPFGARPCAQAYHNIMSVRFRLSELVVANFTPTAIRETESWEAEGQGESKEGM